MIQDLSPSQVFAFQKLQRGGNLFITGAPGTGKSFLLRRFLDQQAVRIPVLASTGAAAILVGGRTFHSFFGLGILQGGPELTFQKAIQNKRLKSRLRKAETIIIDEISMISAEALDCAERIARALRESSEAWGGLRVIAVGDFAQLPPVSRRLQKDWAFLGEAWARSQFENICLRECMRTEEAHYLRVLEQIRWGEISQEVEDFLDELQAREVHEETPRLFPRRYQTERFNLEKLEALPGEERIYETQYYGEDRYLEILEREAPIPARLVLKERALVMIRINDPRQRFVNGTIARVVEMRDDKLVVETSRRWIELEKFRFSYLDADGKEVAVAENFPVSLAYAQTIHKSQGTTMDGAHIDLGSLWEPGQAYVALSRVRNSGALSLENWSVHSFQADPLVKKFYGLLGGDPIS